MSNVLLLGFWCFVVVGTAATLLLPDRSVAETASNESRERLTTMDDLIAEFAEMLVSKGLVTSDQLDLIRHGAKSQAVVTGIRTTGTSREDYREVELAVMVRRLEGGQFPARETALIPASSLCRVSPGSVIDTYYRPGDESAVAVCVPPS